MNYKEFLAFLETMEEKNNLSEQVSQLDTNEIDDLNHILNPLPVKEIIIEENIFSLLPTVRIEIEDQGSYFSGYNIKNGD